MTPDPLATDQSKARKWIIWGVVLLVAAAVIYFALGSQSSLGAEESNTSTIADYTALIVAISGAISALAGLVRAFKGKSEPASP